MSDVLSPLGANKYSLSVPPKSMSKVLAVTNGKGEVWAKHFCPQT